jgi:hypothetical protein
MMMWLMSSGTFVIRYEWTIGEQVCVSVSVCECVCVCVCARARARAYAHGVLQFT